MGDSRNWKIALFGGLSLTALAYAALRAPRYLYDGEVESCEGTPGGDCESLTLRRGRGSGKLFAPFAGKLVGARVGDSMTYILHSEVEPISLSFKVAAGSPGLTAARVSAGALIVQAERIIVQGTYYESGGTVMRPLAPSAWLVAHALLPASTRGTKWCEDSSSVIVPHCEGKTFALPTLPRFTLRPIQVTQ